MTQDRESHPQCEGNGDQVLYSGDASEDVMTSGTPKKTLVIPNLALILSTVWGSFSSTYIGHSSS